MNPLALLTGIPLKIWGYVGVALLVVSLGLTVKIQSHRLASAKAETVTVQAKYDSFVAQVKEASEAAKKAREKDAVDRYVITTKAEAAHAQRLTNLDSRYRAAIAASRVRPKADSPSDGALPLSAAAPIISCGNGQPDAAGLLAELESGILAILKRGDTAIERTIACKQWLDEQANK